MAARRPDGAGFETILFETQQIKAALSAMAVKTGRKDARGIAVPTNLPPAPLPPSASELNPVEKAWPFLCDRHLSRRRSATSLPWSTPGASPGTARSPSSAKPTR